MPVEDLPEIFTSLDSVGDGKIEVEQVGQCLRVAGLTPTQSLIAKMTKPWPQGTRLSVEDIKPVYSNAKKELGPDPSFEQISACLQHYDREGNGSITMPDIRHILTSAGEKLNDAEVNQVLFGFFVADESKVSITEFVKHIQSL